MMVGRKWFLSGYVFFEALLEKQKGRCNFRIGPDICRQYLN